MKEIAYKYSSRKQPDTRVRLFEHNNISNQNKTVIKPRLIINPCWWQRALKYYFINKTKAWRIEFLSRIPIRNFLPMNAVYKKDLILSTILQPATARQQYLQQRTCQLNTRLPLVRNGETFLTKLSQEQYILFLVTMKSMLFPDTRKLLTDKQHYFA